MPLLPGYLIAYFHNNHCMCDNINGSLHNYYSNRLMHLSLLLMVSQGSVNSMWQQASMWNHRIIITFI